MKKKYMREILTVRDQRRKGKNADHVETREKKLVSGQHNHFTRKQLDMSFEQWKLNRDNLKDITQK